MSAKDKTLPTIRFTFSNHRIHIAKAVLYAIGSPTHIQILMASDDTAMYVRKCTEQVFDRFAVPPRVYTEGAFCFGMQKTAFAEAVLRRQNWEADGVYRIIGVSLSDEVMEFRFDQVEKIGTYTRRRKGK